MRNQARANNRIFLQKRRAIEQHKQLVDEWINLLTHFYGHLISDGTPLHKYNNMSMKEFETLVIVHTQMIENDLAAKKRKKKKEEEDRQQKLLEQLKKQGGDLLPR